MHFHCAFFFGFKVLLHVDLMRSFKPEVMQCTDYIITQSNVFWHCDPSCGIKLHSLLKKKPNLELLTLSNVRHFVLQCTFIVTASWNMVNPYNINVQFLC